MYCISEKLGLVECPKISSCPGLEFLAHGNLREPIIEQKNQKETANGHLRCHCVFDAGPGAAPTTSSLVPQIFVLSERGRFGFFTTMSA